MAPLPSSADALGKSTAAVAAWLRLMRVSRALAAAGEQAVRAVGLTGAQFELLAAAGAAEGISQRELAATLAVTKGNIAQIVTRLEDERLVRRVADGRLNRVYLTPRGRQMLGAALPAHAAAIAMATSALDPAGRAQLDAQVATLDRALHDVGPPEDGPPAGKLKSKPRAPARRVDR